MKYVIVTIRRETEPGLPRMRWPMDPHGPWDPQEVDLKKQGPILLCGGLAKGRDTEEALACLTDSLADAYATHADIRIVSEAEANAWLDEHGYMEGPATKVTDVDRLIGMLVKKLVAGADPDQEDLDALDPDKPVAGISRIPKTAEEIFK
jgi:hypothetical protein